MNNNIICTFFCNWKNKNYRKMTFYIYKTGRVAHSFRAQNTQNHLQSGFFKKYAYTMKAKAFAAIYLYLYHNSLRLFENVQSLESPGEGLSCNPVILTTKVY